MDSPFCDEEVSKGFSKSLMIVHTIVAKAFPTRLKYLTSAVVMAGH
jgi:hypothetical protein